MCQALIAIASELHSAWAPLLQRRLIDSVPETFSGRLARRLVNGLSPERMRVALRRAADFRWRIRVLSRSDETLEAIFELQERALQTANQTVAGGARAELASIEAIASHPTLGPESAHLIPDTRSHTSGVTSTPDGVLVHAESPDHLPGMGTVERLEITHVQPPVAPNELARRIAAGVKTKATRRHGVSQFDTRLRVPDLGEQPIPAFGTVLVHVPADVPLTRSIVDEVDVLLRSDRGGNVYYGGRGMQRYLLYQPTSPPTWFSVIRTSPEAFAVRAL